MWALALLLAVPMAVAAQSGLILRVHAGDRLAWDQGAPEAGIEALRFKVYIDGAPRALDVSCRPSSGGKTKFACHATIPSLTPGSHDISISAYLRSNERLESPPSTVIRVRIDDRSDEGATPATATATTARSLASGRMKKVASFVDVEDIALLEDSRIMVAERSGVVHLLSGTGEARTTIALDAVRLEYGGLLSLAAESLPDGSHNLYAMYGSDRGLRVSRISLDNRMLVSPEIVLIDGLGFSAEAGTGVVRIGPDGKLYLALGDGGSSTLMADASAYEGKVLRLNTDGTTPRDAARHSPVYAIGLARPTGLVWINSASLAVVGSEREGLGRLEARARGRRDRSVALNWMPSRAATYFSRAHGDLTGSVLIGDARNGGIWRAEIEADGSVAGAAQITGTDVGSIRAIATSGDGAIYAATASGLWLLLPP